MQNVIFIRFLALFFVIISLSACAVTIKPEEYHQFPDLQPVLTAYRDSVQHARNDPAITWTHGRWGNILVNSDPDLHRGLCYHWQKQVYIDIQEALRHNPWQAIGIAINEGSYFEHHAVLLYDARHLTTKEILLSKHQHKSIVLDPWSSGQADVYRLDDWLAKPWIQHEPARLTKLNVRAKFPPSK